MLNISKLKTNITKLKQILIRNNLIETILIPASLMEKKKLTNSNEQRMKMKTP